MKIIYSPKDVIESSIIQALLESQGINSSTAGEHLQEALGEIPVQGFLKIWVEDQDFESAADIIKKYEKEVLTKPEFSKGWSWNSFFWGIVAAAVPLALIIVTQRYLPESSSFDMNHDGKPDVFYTYRGKELSKIDEDRNFDGQIDETQYYKNGHRVRIESDDAFNGVKNRFYNFEDSNSVEFVFYGGKNVETRTKFVNTVVAESTLIDTATGKIFSKTFYGPYCATNAFFDLNLDGKFDVIKFFDSYEQVIEERKVE